MIKNIISAFFTRGLVAIINLAILLISSRQLGASIIGQVSLLILNITIIQIINEIYTGYSLVHFVAKFPLKKIYFAGLLWTIICIVILNTIFFYLQIGSKELWMHTAILSLVGTWGSFHSVLVLAKEKVSTYNFLVFFQPAILLLTLCVNIFYLQNKTLESYISSLYISFILTLVISGFFVLKILNKKTEHQGEPFSFKAIFKSGFLNQAGNLAHTLSNRYNFYLIGSIILVGIYSRASSLIESVWLISAGITPLVLTQAANQSDDRKNSRLTFFFSKLSFLLSCLAVIVLICLPEQLFAFLLGPDFTGIKQLMLYLSPGILFIGFSTVISHYFSGTGEQKVQLMANSLGLLVTVATAPYLISRYHLAGACYSASLSYFVQALVVTVIFMRRKEFKLGLLFRFKSDWELLRK